jgi:hypothetical protein
MQAPPEKHVFVAALNPPGSKLNDALLVVDVDPGSRTYSQRVGEVRHLGSGMKRRKHLAFGSFPSVPERGRREPRLFARKCTAKKPLPFRPYEGKTCKKGGTNHAHKRN